MQQQSINIKPRVYRQNSVQHPNVYPPHPPSSNPTNYNKPPIPQQCRNRPLSNYQPKYYQSNIYMPPSNNMDNNNSSKKLDSFARVILPKQQSLRNSLNGQPLIRKSNQKPPILFHNNFNTNPSNSKEKLHLEQSKLTSNVHRSSTSVLVAPERRVSKKLSQFFETRTKPQQLIPHLSFSSKPRQNSLQTSKINKTDRTTKNSLLPPKSFFKYSNDQKSSSTNEEVPKINIMSLNSTTYSQVSMNNHLDKPTNKVDFSQKSAINQQLANKGLSPSNNWPLSISPQEKNSQRLFLDPQSQGRVERKISQHQDQSEQFKKKTNFQFFKKIQKKASFRQESKPQKIIKIQDFELLEKVGKGAFGDVFTAQQKATRFVCIIKRILKKTIKDKKLEQQLTRQIKIQSYLDHKHLTPLYGFFDDEKYIYLILEYMQDGSLMQVNKRRRLNQSQVSHYVRQICLGLKYMHTEKVIHRDIKPENIFLNDNYAKIGDFGCSVYTQTFRDTQIGSFAYVSPQQLKLESYNQKIDVWSVGVMAYEMLIGKPPFEADIIQIAKQQKAPQLSKLQFFQNCELSADAKDFLTKMLNLDPIQRLGIDQALRHQFVLKYIRHEDPSLTGSINSTHG